MKLALLARDLVLLRCGPQDTPYAPPLVFTLAALALALDALLNTLVPPSPAADVRLVVLQGGAALSGLLGGTAVVLALAGRQPRYVQTACALLLAEIALGVLALPLAALVGPLPASGANPDATQALAASGLLALGLWNLLVRGHVLRHALEVSLARGVLIALAITFVEGALVVGVLGLGSGAPAVS